MRLGWTWGDGSRSRRDAETRIVIFRRTRALRVHRISRKISTKSQQRSGGPVSRRAGTRDETFSHTRPVWTRALRVHRIPRKISTKSQHRSGGPVSRRAGSRTESFIAGSGPSGDGPSPHTACDCNPASFRCFTICAPCARSRTSTITVISTCPGRRA